MFKRTIEDFTCAHCGLEVKGDGYTDHCPRCLWGMHVDIQPGDRASSCGGIMMPIEIEGSSPDYRIVYRCETCGHVFRVKAAFDDDVDALLSLTKK